MRKLLFALVLMMTGAFAFGAGTPATAMTAGGLAAVSDVVKADGATEQVHYRRYRHDHYRRHFSYRPYNFCWHNPYHWRCRPHHRRHHYYRRYW